MVLFYTHLRQGLSKAEALRAAQMNMRQKYPHPYYWAGFVLTGDPGPAWHSQLAGQFTTSELESERHPPGHFAFDIRTRRWQFALH